MKLLNKFNGALLSAIILVTGCAGTAINIGNESIVKTGDVNITIDASTKIYLTSIDKKIPKPLETDLSGFMYLGTHSAGSWEGKPYAQTYYGLPEVGHVYRVEGPVNVRSGLPTWSNFWQLQPKVGVVSKGDYIFIISVLKIGRNRVWAQIAKVPQADV